MSAKIAAIYPFPSALQRQAEALRRSEACLAAAQRLTRTGSFVWNVSSGEIFWSGEMYRIFAFDPASAFSIELILQRTHPEDRAMVQQIIEEATREEKDFDFEHRLQMPDGSIKYVQVVAVPVKGERRVDQQLVGAVTDITERKHAQQELQQIVDLVPQLIVVLDSDGTVIHGNRVVREYTGLTLDEFRSLDVRGKVIHSDDLKRMQAARERGLAGSEPFELDARMLGKDGIHRWFLFRYSPLREECRVCRWYVSATEIESRKQEEERVRQENVRLEERTRIARELHDTLLQTVQGASLQLGATLYEVPSDLAVKPRLERILELMLQGVAEGRVAIQDLRSSGLHTLDLVFALSRVPEELNVKPDIEFRVTVTGQQNPWPLEIQDEIYRIGREALANAFRHSGAKRIELQLDYSGTELNMRIRDNGRGIDPELLEKGRGAHWGLTGMRERATKIGGTVTFLSDATAGTVVTLSVPNKSST